MFNKKLKPSVSIVSTLILFLVVSVLLGINKQNLYTYNINTSYYTYEDNFINNNINSSYIKNINNLNKNFIESIDTADLDISIYPKSNLYNDFVIEIKSNTAIDNSKISSIYDEYKSYMLKNSDEIIHMSHIESYDTQYMNSNTNYIIWQIIRSLLLILSILIFIKSLKKFDEAIYNWNYLHISILLTSIFSLVFSLTVIYSILLITSSLILYYLNKLNDNFNLKLILSLSIIAKIIILIGILGLNYLKFGTLISYLQPDEIFYYSTATEIGSIFSSFSMPNFSQIVGLDQYGYNAFIGFIKALNGGQSFFTIKLINICLCTVFIFVIYDFTYKITTNKICSRFAALFIAVMPTFSLFSTFALRDVLISLIMVLILMKTMDLVNGDSTNTALDLFILLGSFISLWYLRRFALLIMIGISLFYLMLKVAKKLKLSVLSVGISLIVVAGLVIYASTKLYSFSIFTMIVNYFKMNGFINSILGLVFSMINLDFLLNMDGSIYTSLKSMILRLLYPETLMLITTFPLFIYGSLKLLRKKYEVIIPILAMCLGLILIYRIEYGGWFLRTQLQILPYQYIVTSIGITALIKRFNPSFKTKLLSPINKFLR